MAKARPWYETLFKRDYYDYFYIGGPRGFLSAEQEAQKNETQVDFIVKALDLEDGARILDLCCGHGRHAVPLAQRGFRVTGLDLSAYHLRLAKAAARRAGVEAAFVRSDMREVPRGPFDAVINMFTAFGYFDDDEENQRVLNGVARSLKRGGRFLIDYLNFTYLCRVFRESDCMRRPDGSLAIEMRSHDVRTGRNEVETLHIEPDGRQHKRSHSVRMYSFRELETMLAQAGLRVTNAWGNFDGSDLTMQSHRMIVLAERAPR
jgi:SAM-dependent methyltransferase